MDRHTRNLDRCGCGATDVDDRVEAEEVRRLDLGDESDAVGLQVVHETEATRQAERLAEHAARLHDRDPTVPGPEQRSERQRGLVPTQQHHPLAHQFGAAPGLVGHPLRERVEARPGGARGIHHDVGRQRGQVERGQVDAEVDLDAHLLHLSDQPAAHLLEHRVAASRDEQTAAQLDPRSTRVTR